MNAWRYKWLGLTVLILGISALLFAVGARAASNEEYRWDILQNVADIVPGGTASACASDGSTITLTGSGTFRSNSGFPQDVTGGGTWKTYGPSATCTGSPIGAPSGALTGSGTYQVTAFVTFTLAPGSISGAMDFIGNIADARAGQVVLRITYSDGTEGVLAYGCMLVGTPESVLEGITASKGFVDYWHSVIAPVTVFHKL